MAASLWQTVCRADDIPAAGARVLHISGIEIALFRTRHGAILALENRCPHKGGKLSEGIVADHTVLCPLHGWRIDMVTGEAVNPDKGCVKRYPITVRDGDVLVRLDEEPTNRTMLPLCDAVGSHADTQRPKLGRRRATVEDFTLHDFDRDIPVLAVEPPSPDDCDSYTLTITADKRRGALAQYTFKQLSRRFPVVESAAHITCLMFGFTRPVIWQGVRLVDVLEDAGIQDHQFGSFYSWDTLETKEGERFFETLPRDYMLDPRSLLVFGMNGKPLPKEHGGPVRLALPFLQGYKSVKWLTWIKLSNEDEIGYKKLHGFIFFPELSTPPGFTP
ncbi:MAG: nitrite reductase small subunit NirD [Candidatus Sumerlaeaceae bacterium]